MEQLAEDIDVYKYHDLPWVSKSRLQAYNFCPFNFYLGEVAQMAPKCMTDEMEKRKIAGTDIHLVIALFWKKVVETDMISNFMRMPLEYNFKNSQLYWAFYSIAESVLPESMRGIPEFGAIISNFAQFQVENWIAVSEKIGTTRQAYKKYWIPLFVELFLEDPSHLYYGTIDSIYYNPNFETDKKPFIVMDYKTGSVPKSVWNFRGENRLSIKLPTPKLQELHFYAWLMANAVTKIDTQMKACSEEECEGFVMMKVEPAIESGQIAKEEDSVFKCQDCGKEYTKEEKENLRDKYITVTRRVFPKLNSYNDVLICVVFLGYDKPYSVPKKCNKKTMENVHRDAELLRINWRRAQGPDDWEKQINDFKCPKCFHSSNCTEIQMKEALA